MLKVEYIFDSEHYLRWCS